MTFAEQVRDLFDAFLGTALGLFEVFFQDVFTLLLFVTDGVVRLLGGPF